MNRREHLLTHATEECAEVAQRLTKALRFGIDETQEGKSETNYDRIVKEYNDLVAVMEMAGFPLSVINGLLLDDKRRKVERYLAYARSQGTLTD